MTHGIGFRTAAMTLLAASALLAPALQARQCSGNGDIVGPFGFTASRSGFYLLGATAATSSSGSGILIPVPVTPPGTTGSVASFVGSNTNIGNLLTGLVNSRAFSAVGRIFADGAGNLYASPTVGLISNIQAGTYTVSASCSITMTLTDPFIANASTLTTTPGLPVTLTGYISSNGAELDMFGSNGATVTFLKQSGNCNNSSLNGDFTISGTGFYFPSAGNGLTTTVGQPAVTPSGTTTGPCVNGTATTSGSGCIGAFTTGATGALGTPFSLLARFVADGNGVLTTDFSGQQSTGQNVTGIYSVNADCTGTAHVVDAAGITRNISFVLVNQAAQCSLGASSQSSGRQALEFVFSDPGVMGGGIAQLQ